MRKRLVHLVIFLAFGAGLGHFAFRAYGPRVIVDYRVGGEVQVLLAAEPRGKNLYLRQALYLPQRPRSGWIQVLGFDHVQLYVNGVLLDQRKSDPYPVAVLADLTPHLREGRNVLAVVSHQTTLHHTPVVSVEGAYVLDDGEHRIGVDGTWRYREHFERRDDYWFAPDFDDSHWSMAQRETRTIRATVPCPVRAMTAPNTGKWISPDVATATRFSVRRDFDVPERVAHAWLRVQCTAPYRLAVNGTVIDTREEQLGTTAPVPNIQWVYDVSPFMRRGPNVVSLAVTTEQPPAHVKAGLEVQGQSGTLYGIAGDSKWRWRSGADDWRACQVETGDLGIHPWNTARRLVRDVVPPGVHLHLLAREAIVMLAATVLSWLAVCLTRRKWFGAKSGGGWSGVSPVVLALVPATIFLLAAVAIASDPRVEAQQVYRTIWLIVAVALVVAQWFGLAKRRGNERLQVPRGASDAVNPAHPPVPLAQRAWTVWLALLLVIVAGAYLRIRDMAARPLSPDEVSMYRTTMGFWERGFPSIVIHPDIPVIYATTSELVYCGSALAALLFDDERLVIRAPSVAWGTLTIFLLFWSGRRMFRPWVGVTAAALYAFSPFCIEMANIGRYYSQLQGFTLLTAYFFYRTIEPTDSLNRRALWLTVLCFIGMFLSWEGSVLFAVPLMTAAVLHRRGRLGTILREPAVWQGMLVVAAVVVLQGAHRNMVQISRPFFGSGASDVSVTPMWRYPGFDLWYYVKSASWNGETPLAMLALWGGGLLAIRHPFRRQARVLLIVFVVAAIVQALVLPVTAKRYAYHFLPMWALLASVAVVAIARGVSRVRAASGQSPLRIGGPLGTQAATGQWIGALLVVSYVVFACGLTVDFADARAWRITGGNLKSLQNPGQEPATRFVLEHLEPDDVVIVNGPHVIDHYLGRNSDYWLETQMHLQATMDDRRPIPLHRLKGTMMLRDLNHVKDAFSRHQRIWYITESSFHARTNLEETSRFIRGNMDMVYEDYASMVFFRGDQHRAVSLQRRNDASLSKSKTQLLP